MSNVFDDTRAAVREANATLRAADTVANDMAELLRGRLGHVRPHILKQLKKELKDFNMHTQRWMD